MALFPLFSSSVPETNQFSDYPFENCIPYRALKALKPQFPKGRMLVTLKRLNLPPANARKFAMSDSESLYF